MKKILILVMGVMTTQLYSQFQVGDDIIGKTDENSGWSVALAKNLNGQPQMLAVGGPSVTKGGIESGTVRVYKLVNNNWVQKGSELIGSNIDDQFGYSLSMPDINTLAIGIPGSDVKSVDCGEVKIYKWDGSDWIFNSSIFGSDSFDNFGFAISMPSKNVIAVSSPNNHGTGPEEKWTQMGQVKIFKLNQTAWEQIGNNLNGSNQGDKFGYCIDMPDSITIGISSINNNSGGAGNGQVKVYQYNYDSLNWIQKGADLNGGENSTWDQSGWSISMADKSTIAIGAPDNDGNCNNCGHIRIYSWDARFAEWVQKGEDIDGEFDNNKFGYSVSMNSSNLLAASSINYTGTDGDGCGYVRAFKFDSTLNNWVQFGNNIEGKAGERSGASVSFENNLIAIGAPLHSVNLKLLGKARVYSIEELMGYESVQQKIYILNNSLSNGQNIKIQGLVENSNFIIIDNMGRVIQSGFILKDNPEIQLMNFVSGIYYLIIDGQYLYKSEIVVE